MKLSIIVPTFNRENYIEKCIDSVLNQTYKNLELIIIDDGSTDNTKEIINKYDDKRLKYFVNSNHGIGYSRNDGLNKATGDYIFFLDSDDYLDENMVEIVAKNVSNSDILIFGYKEFFEKNNNIKETLFNVFNCYTLSEHPELINEINLGPCNKVFKKSLLDDYNIRYPLDVKYEDTLFIIEAFKNASSISSINEILTNIVVHKGNETLTVDERVFDIFKILDNIKNILNKKLYEEDLNKLIVSKITTYTVSQRTQKNKKLINQFINKAFDYLKKNVKDYKNNKYYQNRSFFKRIIEKNKYITMIYCHIYRLVKSR